jgi:hypothetical protein
MMSRFRQALGAVLATALLTVTSVNGLAQDAGGQDVALRGQMASITLDRTMLPGGYTIVGETFFSADQVASGDVTADELTGAGFASQYVSVYRNLDNGNEIRSYVSAWTDGAAAEAGFEILEDEGRTQPDGTFEDGDAGVGEAPGETTTGSWSESGTTVNSVDVTFRVDRFLVGTALTTRDGSEADAATVGTLSGTLEARATEAIGNESPDGTDLALVPQALPLSTLAPSLQVGFLGGPDVEQMYGLQGSALGGLTASWNEVVALAEDGAAAPYVSVGLTSFGSAEGAQAVIDQIGDLAPEVAGSEQVEGYSVEGATASAAFQFPSQASGSDEADSFRIVAIVDATLIVIDVQGSTSVEVAQSTAETLITAQLGCLGQESCEVPGLPEELTGA